MPPLNFSLFELLLIIGITQGVVISLLIWTCRRKTPDKIILSLLLTVFNLLCVRIILLSSGLWQISWIRYLPLPFELSMQPLIYLYIVSLTQANFHLRRKDWLHFVPFLVSLAYSLFIYLQVLPESNLTLKDQIANSYGFNPVKESEDYLSVVSAVIYGVLSYHMLTKYRRWLSDQTSNTLYPSYSWLRNLLLLFGVLFAMLLVNLLLDLKGYAAGHFFHWQMLFVYIAALIYYLGFRGYQLRNPVPIVAEPSPVRKIGRDLSEATLTMARKVILQALEQERLYLDPDLSLASLSQTVGYTPSIVSACINTGWQKNFRQLINVYRVEAVKARLQAQGSAHLSLLGIAYECGFDSEASFY
jgi:AraC-like DNA-binding protein